MNTTQSLITALAHPDETQRRQAALALGAAQDSSVVDALVDRIRVEPSSCVREDLTWAIVQHAAAAEPQLSALLESRESDDRRTAAHVLSKVADPAHFERVSPLVADGHADVAIKAYRAAANTGGARAVDALAARLGDGDLLQRDALTNAFASIGAESVPVLVAALASDRPEVREHAVETLGHLGEDATAAAAPLAAVAEDAEPTIRIAAVAALGQLGEASLEMLRRLADGPDPVVAQLAARYLA
ncbi:HEAT repeat [Tessaracoccus bendigoensis DSM 12906]|uniref:HEAT repeat n=1 Tax=Tessaracoccus bendigoensis DSM 12906 TaxID=1123357 RepID=A0A1M6I0U5_9ACTN|nr:HEAT repeat domain-containing protein [Tessaracoccus bendigoensis]SHJ28047.1 HEAT repeat [Tessaracoccus bendigoensis DSM 12906]